MSRSFFHEPNAFEAELDKHRSEGKTVFVSSQGVLKIKRGEGVIAFQPFTRFDQMAGRNIACGGYHVTTDPDEIAFIDGFRGLSLKKLPPIFPVVKDVAKEAPAKK